MVSHLKMAVFHCPMVSLCSTTFITWLAPTKAKTLKFSTIGLCSPLSITRGLFLVRVATPVQKYVYPDPIPEFAVYVLPPTLFIHVVPCIILTYVLNCVCVRRQISSGKSWRRNCLRKRRHLEMILIRLLKRAPRYV